jgi:hypothetical protein
MENKTAQQLLNETEAEAFTIEERTDLNINKVTHDKLKRLQEIRSINRVDKKRRLVKVVGK